MNTSQRGFIEACEREQLHLSGAIQAHGAMVIVDHAGKITHVSDNISRIYGEVTEADIGKGLPDVLWNLFRQFDGETCWFADEVMGLHGELDVVLTPLDKQQIALELVPSHD